MIKPINIKSTAKSWKDAAAWMDNKKAVAAVKLFDRVGSDIAQYTKEYLQHTISSGLKSKGSSGQLKRAIFYKAYPNGVLVGADLAIAPYARIREKGGTIKATAMSKVRGRVGGKGPVVPMLAFQIDGDWVNTPQVTQRGNGYLSGSIKTRLRNAGPTPSLSKKLGMDVSKILKTGNM